jgi:hypothetical protein
MPRQVAALAHQRFDRFAGALHGAQEAREPALRTAHLAAADHVQRTDHARRSASTRS